jgi:hypothetical protein
MATSASRVEVRSVLPSPFICSLTPLFKLLLLLESLFGPCSKSRPVFFPVPLLDSQPRGPPFRLGKVFPMRWHGYSVLSFIVRVSPNAPAAGPPRRLPRRADKRALRAGANVIMLHDTAPISGCKKKNHKKSHFDVDSTLGRCTMATMSNRTIRISKASHSIITRWRVRTGLPRSRVADEAITLANQLWAATGFVLNGKKRKEGKQ